MSGLSFLRNYGRIVQQKQTIYLNVQKIGFENFQRILLYQTDLFMLTWDKLEIFHLGLMRMKLFQ